MEFGSEICDSHHLEVKGGASKRQKEISRFPFHPALRTVGMVSGNSGAYCILWVLISWQQTWIIPDLNPPAFCCIQQSLSIPIQPSMASDIYEWQTGAVRTPNPSESCLFGSLWSGEIKFAEHSICMYAVASIHTELLQRLLILQTPQQVASPTSRDFLSLWDKYPLSCLSLLLSVVLLSPLASPVHLTSYRRLTSETFSALSSKEGKLVLEVP